MNTNRPGAQLAQMLLITTMRFDGMFDKAGHPYILHCLKVMHYCKTEDEELQCIALGHDLLEDTFATPEEGIAYLRSKGFTERVIAGIYALTKLPGQAYEEYKRAVKANPDSTHVKKADLRHNSDIRRLKGVTQKDIERTVRYHEFYLELERHSSGL